MAILADVLLDRRFAHRPYGIVLITKSASELVGGIGSLDSIFSVYAAPRSIVELHPCLIGLELKQYGN
jgi:hypothetical protein